MKSFFETLTLELSLRPELGRLLSSALLSAVIVLFGLLVSFMLYRRSAASRSVLWRRVMLGLLFLAFWQMIPPSQPPVTLHLEIAEPVVSAQTEPLKAAAVSTVLDTTKTADLPLVMPTPNRRAQVLNALDDYARPVWLGLAILLFMVRTIRGQLSLLVLKKRATPVSERLQACLQAVSKEMSIRSAVTCVKASDLSSPLLTGLMRGKIWLPLEAEEWSQDRLQAVFRHELAHLSRHDLGWQLITRLARCVWWWQPLVGNAARWAHSEAEQAADDVAVGKNGDTHSYARTLVEIAAGWKENMAAAPAVGVAMFGNRENLQHRVRQLLRENRWRGTIGAGALVVLLVFGLVLLLIASTRVEFTPRTQTYQSLAKLVAGGRIVAQEGNVGWQEQLTDFYGTIIETLESAEMKKRALARVHALHPQLKDSNVEIRVHQTKGSAIFNVFAVGSEKVFTKIFLDAMLDEFVAFRQQIREQGLERALNTFTETVVKKSQELQERTERLEAFRKAHNGVILKSEMDIATATLQASKERLYDAKRRLSELEFMILNPDAALGNLERGFTADGAAKLDSSRQLTTMEQSYLKARAEAFSQDQELSFLEQSKTAPSQEEQLKMAKANHVKESWKKVIVKDSETDRVTVTKQLIALEKDVTEKQNEAIQIGQDLAELSRLEEEFRATKLAHDQMFERVQKFQDFQNVQTDYVAIQEHASTAYADVSNKVQIWRWWTPKPENDETSK
jgi:beta-lactamase regulating signal transducer with metallopeptidase domain